MFDSIPSNGSPENSSFGVIGELFISDLGKLYVKSGSDTLNVGWVEVLGNTPVPTPTPTPTPTPIVPTPTPTPGPTPTPTPTPTPVPPMFNFGSIRAVGNAVNGGTGSGATINFTNNSSQLVDISFDVNVASVGNPVVVSSSGMNFSQLLTSTGVTSFTGVTVPSGDSSIYITYGPGFPTSTITSSITVVAGGKFTKASLQSTVGSSVNYGLTVGNVVNNGMSYHTRIRKEDYVPGSPWFDNSGSPQTLPNYDTTGVASGADISMDYFSSFGPPQVSRDGAGWVEITDIATPLSSPTLINFQINGSPFGGGLISSGSGNYPQGQLVPCTGSLADPDYIFVWGDNVNFLVYDKYTNPNVFAVPSYRAGVTSFAHSGYSDLWFTSSVYNDIANAFSMSFDTINNPNTTLVLDIRTASVSFPVNISGQFSFGGLPMSITSPQVVTLGPTVMSNLGKNVFIDYSGPSQNIIRGHLSVSSGGKFSHALIEGLVTPTNDTIMVVGGVANGSKYSRNVRDCTNNVSSGFPDFVSDGSNITIDYLASSNKIAQLEFKANNETNFYATNRTPVLP